MADIFLSYARTDLDLAEPVRSRLEALGLEVFFDIEGGIDSGDAFPQAVGDAVAEAKVVVACWSPVTMTRPWCRKECFMAQEQGKLVPIAIAPLRPAELKEFVDVSYESLVDFDGASPHFGWSQSLASIARKLDNWAEANPEDPDVDVTLALAVKVRTAALRARPKAARASAMGQTGAASIWNKVDQNDPADLLAFAESFPNSVEAFEARRRVERLRKEDVAFAKVDLGSRKDLEAFLATWPDSYRRDDVMGRLGKMSAAQLVAENQQRILAAAKVREEELAAQKSAQAAQAAADAARMEAKKKAVKEAARKLQAERLEAFQREQKELKEAELERRWGWLLAIVGFAVDGVGWVFERISYVTAWYFAGLAVLDRFSGGTPGSRGVYLLRDFFFEADIVNATGLWGFLAKWAVAPLVGTVLLLITYWGKAALLNVGFILIMISVVKESWDDLDGFVQKLSGVVAMYLVTLTLWVRLAAWLVGKWAG